MKTSYPGGYDKDGNLTDEPGPIEQSMRILPTGYWKGSSMAILLDAMAALLSAGEPTNGIDKIQKGAVPALAKYLWFLIQPNWGRDFTNKWPTAWPPM